MLRKTILHASALLCLVSLAATAFGQTDSSEAKTGAEVELRKPRVWAISGEIGINSLGSLLGPVATWYAKPRLAVDFGAGLSTNGLRPGVRARYLFSLDKTAYFAGAGLKYALGSGDREAKVKDPDTNEELKVKTDGCGFADLMLGVEYLADNGFVVIADAGYSQLLGGVNYHVTGGTPSAKADKAFKTIFGSGIMLSVSLGKAF